MSVLVDLEHGGRWTSMALAHREWLWRRDDPARWTAGPGDAFVDAGGLEECLPTVRGVPDHGSAWSRPWDKLGPSSAAVTGDDYELERHIVADANSVIASYRLEAEPGYRFVWAAHALLDVSEDAALDVLCDTPIRLYPEAAPYLDHPWPAGAPYVTTRWPECGGIPLGHFGPVDGTAVGAIAVGCDTARVTDRSDVLNLRVEAKGLPCSVAIWRNLGGYPADSPYRSIGVEPMLGSVFDLAEAADDRDAVTVPTSGEAEWRLIVTSHLR